MIYDGHAYCFPNLNGLGGFNDFKTFNKHQQIAISQHFQPVWSDIDRKIIKDVSKIKPADKWYIKSAKDIDFNPAHRGRYEWTDKGVKYVKQYMPPSVTNMEYMPEDLIAEMDYAGVDMALLHRTPYLGIGNKYIYDCVQRFPNRLQGLAHVPEWKIIEELDQSIDNLVYAITKLNMKGLQFLPDHMTLYGKEENWDSPIFKPFWDVLSDLNVPLFITPGYNSLQGTSDLIGNLGNELIRIGKWMKKYPSVKVVWTHGLAWRLFIKGHEMEIPELIYKSMPTDNSNFYLQLLFPVLLGNIWDYPMKQVLPTLKELNNRIGSDRLIWGTDIPMVMRFFTYKQCLDQIHIYGREVLSENDISMICGGTMSELMAINK